MLLKILEPHNTLIHKVTLKNYRCFGERQTATLAPLTLLVGENNAGKSSFMAMIRVLLKLAGGRTSNFQKEPFDLGTISNMSMMVRKHLRLDSVHEFLSLQVNRVLKCLKLLIANIV